VKSISDKSYTLHSQHNLTDKKQYEVVSKDSKEEILSELINYFEVVGLQYKGYDNGEIELMMLIDDNYKIQVDDETGKEKDKIEKVIKTLKTLTSMIEDTKIDNNMNEMGNHQKSLRRRSTTIYRI
jgi:hypothetical protein